MTAVLIPTAVRNSPCAAEFHRVFLRVEIKRCLYLDVTQNAG